MRSSILEQLRRAQQTSNLVRSITEGHVPTSPAIYNNRFCRPLKRSRVGISCRTTSEVAMKIHYYGTLLVVLTLPVGTASGQRTTAAGAPRAAATAPSASQATMKAVSAAKAFLATLDERQRAKVSLELNRKTRSNWSNLPTGTVFQNGATERNGLKLGEMTAAQQNAALALVAATLSPGGFQKVINIVNADETLERASSPARPATNRVRFGKAEYYVAILGTPSETQPWMIQFGGHHLAINITLAGSENALTPSHTGAQPSMYSFNGETIRPLGKENDKAFALINAL